jgi:hypothetical protein
MFTLPSLMDFWGRIWKEAALVSFEMLSQPLSGKAGVKQKSSFTIIGLRAEH